MIGDGRDVPKILFEGQGLPMKGVLNVFCIDASGMQADTSANMAQVSHPSVESGFIDNSINAVGEGPEGCCDVLSLYGASEKAIGGEEGKRICWRKVEIKPTLDDAHEGRDGA